jgi:hypothetical protein
VLRQDTKERLNSLSPRARCQESQGSKPVGTKMQVGDRKEGQKKDSSRKEELTVILE